MSTSTQTQKKRLPEQTAQHVYGQVPLRASAKAPRTTGQPPASPHGAGHSAGIHPEDHPDWTPESDDLEDVENSDAFYPATRPPNSARRYGQTPTRTEIQVTHHEAPPTRARRAGAMKQTTQDQRSVQHPGPHWLVPLGVGMVIMLVLWLLGSMVVSWVMGMHNDLTYGRPRTTQIDARVGHNDSPTHPSHFIALNMNGRVIIVEFPGGDAASTKVIIGPTLTADHSLDPVTLEFRDVNGDGKPDMIITVADVREVFINDNGSFRPVQKGDHINL